MLGLILCYGYVGMVLLAAYGLQGYGEEKSRKFVHIMTANWWLIVMVFFKTVWGPLLVSSSFLIVNLLAYRYKFFRQIEVHKRDPGYGTIYYSMSMMGLTVLSFCMNNLCIGLVGCLALGYGDGIAALMGQRFPIRVYHIGNNRKSVGGSTGMFVVVTCVVILADFIAQQPFNLATTLLIAASATFFEAIAHGGRDNLWVPLVSGILYGFL